VGTVDEEERIREALDREEEYIDEDQYTTVTIEAVDVTKEGLSKSAKDSEDEDGEEQEKAKVVENGDAKKSGKKSWPKKERKKKFRYESKVERKFTRAKQKSGNKAKANARRGND